MLRLTFCLLLVCFSLAGNAVPVSSGTQNEFNQQFESSRISFLRSDSEFLKDTPGKYSPFVRFIFDTFFSTVPTGESLKLSGSCDALLWGRRLQDERVRESAALQGALIQKYLKDCDGQLQTNATSSFRNTTRMLSMEMSSKDNSFLQPVLFHLPGNVKVKGLLALKGDFKKRPMVVIRVSVFSNSAEFFPERAWLMMLFEQTSFNVLLLENMASSEFIAHNTRFAFGGYDEGIQNILIAKILQDPNEPLHRVIDSLHLFGMSLGGHGVLFASLLNELNSPKGKPLYNSFLGMCPVVDLEATVHELIDRKPFGYFVDMWSQRRFSQLRERWSTLDDAPMFGFLRTAVSELVRTYQGGLSFVGDLKLPAGMQDGPQFWKLNDFWSAYKDVRQPVLIMSTLNDPIVPYALNSSKIHDKTLKLPNSNVSVVEFKEGLHCTLPVAYEWKAISSVMQSYFLSHSPNFRQEWQDLKVELDHEATYIGFKISEMKPEDSFVKVAVRLEGKDKAREELNLNLPLSQFDFRFMNKTLSVPEQQMLVRWIHQNLNFKVDSVEGKWFLTASWPTAK